jgi:hypothetical protein
MSLFAFSLATSRRSRSIDALGSRRKALNRDNAIIASPSGAASDAAYVNPGCKTRISSRDMLWGYQFRCHAPPDSCGTLYRFSIANSEDRPAPLRGLLPGGSRRLPSASYRREFSRVRNDRRNSLPEPGPAGRRRDATRSIVLRLAQCSRPVQPMFRLMCSTKSSAGSMSLL